MLSLLISIFSVYFIDSISAAPTNIEAEITFYGARDNCPPGGDIAYPDLHQLAGGTGTFKDPITYAGSIKATPKGSIIYVEFLQKYFLIEDDCEECDEDWAHGNKYHFDLWMGPDNVTAGPYLIACEDGLTPNSKSKVILNPNDNLTVNMTKLFNGNDPPNGCIIDPDPCTTNKPNQCGNECEIPNSGTCQQIANQLLLNMTRFEQLNPKLDCSQVIKQGTTVCMGGPCGC